LGFFPERYCRRFADLSTTDDVGILENLLSWVRPHELATLCRDRDLLPVRRWFEPQWEYVFPRKSSRLERLSALNTEIDVRLRLANDYLFKVDMASMRSSLEARVPMLDEDLVEFGLTLPHRLKVHAGKSKRVLRGIAVERLPRDVALKPKGGFGIPFDSWVDGSCRANMRDYLLRPDCRLPEFFRPDAYVPLIEAFCDNRVLPEISKQGLSERVVMLLSLELCLTPTSRDREDA
jgi:asparagine synthase (glutamine-hydrolysing)